jgi:hypothetical protein
VSVKQQLLHKNVLLGSQFFFDIFSTTNQIVQGWDRFCKTFFVHFKLLRGKLEWLSL